jgi:hypothetical protein
MRHIRTIILVSLILATSAIKAQYKPIVFGVKFAPNLGWMKSDLSTYETEGVKPGYSWGFFGDFFIMENYAIETGFNVQNFSGALKYPHAVTFEGDTTPTFGTLNRSYKFRYIEVPLIFKMHLSASEKSKFFGKIGLGTGFRLKARAEDEFVYEGGTETNEDDISNEIKQVRNSLIIGAGYQFAFQGTTSLLVEFIYNDGFVDVLKGSNTADPTIDHMASNRFIELGVGIIF